MGVVPPYRKLVTGREIKGTETCDLAMTDLVTPPIFGVWWQTEENEKPFIYDKRAYLGACMVMID